MTRINAGIPVEELCDAHLLAEHREIKRIPNTVRKKDRVDVSKLPTTFRLGKGHVTFFYDKILFLSNRYSSIYIECKRRGFNTSDYSDAFENLPPYLMNDWKVPQEASDMVRERINERLAGMKNIRYTKCQRP